MFKIYYRKKRTLTFLIFVIPIFIIPKLISIFIITISKLLDLLDPTAFGSQGECGYKKFIASKIIFPGGRIPNLEPILVLSIIAYMNAHSVLADF